jgi:hypothetical protein
MATSEHDEPIDPEFEIRYREALARGQERKRNEPFATTVRFVSDPSSYLIRLSTGVGFEIPAAAIHELEGATPEQLGQVSLFGEGEGIHWEALDVDISIGTLINRAFGETVRRMAARKAAATTSTARAKSARENGKKGGRPRKRAV